ncbi:hypothetical protein [Aeromicrobium sp. Leaf291]|uniref:hypothetical protein n=1 Tax=Aeromicrobium sp. Leaf291 TaxID=1736325 RepID=UPI0006FFC7C8|nr:hypothetical protein [Aeromicrobium sp. Leaf291]KQP81610.1 hypothetical protein ASF35_16395 [Aeromicrobium sp. Leaf291]
MTDHLCEHDEVELGEDDASELLPAGARVLLPCSCGETALSTLELAQADVDALQAALQQVEPYRLLYHWSPTRHRKQIIRRGLLPGRRAVTHSTNADLRAAGFNVAPDWRAPYVCFADCPSWAWALSGLQRSAPAGEWDLWQTSLDRLTDPWVEPSDDRPSGLHEVRTPARVYKRDLWLIGSRTKEA